MNLQELIDFHVTGAEACEAYAVTPGASEAKNKDIAKHYTKRAKWHRDAVELMTAGQHQGEPVAWSLEVEGYTTVLYENYQKALSEQEHFRGRGRTAEIYPLHRERPVPVAVVMPSQRAMTNRYIHDQEAVGWNACLAEVVRLNGVKP